MVKTVSYDKENDILFIHNGFSPDERFKGNIDADAFILDVSTKGRIRGVEIMNVSKFFKEFNIGKNILEDIADAKFDAVIKPNAIIVSIIVTAKNLREEFPAKIAVPLATPIAV